jgi:hypothetical protein
MLSFVIMGQEPCQEKNPLREKFLPPESMRPGQSDLFLPCLPPTYILIPPSVVSLIRLYNDLRLVIPGKLVPAKAGSGNPGSKHWIPGQARNDDIVNLSLRHYLRSSTPFASPTFTVYLSYPAPPPVRALFPILDQG